MNQPAQKDALEAMVDGLGPMGLDELREAWRRLYGPPPSLRSVELLRRLLAFRIQADALGGLDQRTRDGLMESGKTRRVDRLTPGARLVREWRGVRHEIEITDQGVRYGDATFASLSEVARAITGVRWSGPRFFGLTKDAQA